MVINPGRGEKEKILTSRILHNYYSSTVLYNQGSIKIISYTCILSSVPPIIITTSMATSFNAKFESTDLNASVRLYVHDTNHHVVPKSM